MPRGVYDRAKLKTKTEKTKVESTGKRQYTKTKTDKVVTGFANNTNWQDDVEKLTRLLGCYGMADKLPSVQSELKAKIASVLHRIEPQPEGSVPVVEAVEPKKRKASELQIPTVSSTPLPFNPQVPPNGQV